MIILRDYRKKDEENNKQARTVGLQVYNIDENSGN